MSNSKGPIDMEKKDNLGGDKLPASHLVRLAQHRLGKQIITILLFCHHCRHPCLIITLFNLSPRSYTNLWSNLSSLPQKSFLHSALVHTKISGSDLQTFLTVSKDEVDEVGKEGSDLNHLAEQFGVDLAVLDVAREVPRTATTASLKVSLSRNLSHPPHWVWLIHLSTKHKHTKQ